jgi:tetrahydromethanopterin S-methyltransferase subunit C
VPRGVSQSPQEVVANTVKALSKYSPDLQVFAVAQIGAQLGIGRKAVKVVKEKVKGAKKAVKAAASGASAVKEKVAKVRKQRAAPVEDEPSDDE